MGSGSIWRRSWRAIRPGNVLPNPPVLWDIESDPALAGTKLIAEAWDAAGLYQVGSFVGDSWKEWNGRFRDDVREFFRGEAGRCDDLRTGWSAARRSTATSSAKPEQSVNFVTCHDGFTLNDLVSYNQKHNEANGENNRDGANDNRSWNCGVEGPTDDPAVETAAQPAGEELPDRHDAVARRADDPDGRRSPPHAAGQQQRLLPGQRNQLVRLDAARQARGRASVRDAAQRAPAVARLEHERQRMSLSELHPAGEKAWHGVKLNQPDWSEWSHSVAFAAEIRQEGLLVHLILNAYWEPLEFELPRCAEATPGAGGSIRGCESPHDIVPWQAAAPVSGAHLPGPGSLRCCAVG